MGIARCCLLILFVTRAWMQTARVGSPTFQWDSGPFTELSFKHTIAKSRQLNRPERTALVKSIIAQLRKTVDPEDAISEKELYRIALSSRLRFADLNDDGVSEAIVQPVGVRAGCGATGNCPLWVFSKLKNGYRVILDSVGERYRIESGLDGGYHEIAIASHDAAKQKHILVYGYNRGTYLLIKCYQAWWVETSGGNLKFLKRPSVTPCKN